MARKTTPLDHDPGVLAALRDVQRRKDTRGMSQAEKGRYAAKQLQVKKTWALDRELVAIVEAIAAHHGCPPAGVVNWMLLFAARAFASGEIEVEDVLSSSNSPRWAWVVRIPSTGGMEDEVLKRLESGREGVEETYTAGDKASLKDQP